MTNAKRLSLDQVSLVLDQAERYLKTDCFRGPTGLEYKAIGFAIKLARVALEDIVEESKGGTWITKQRQGCN